MGVSYAHEHEASTLEVGAGSSVQSGLPYLASWALVVYGATLIVTGSVIFAPIRAAVACRVSFFGKLLHCPLCFGWWVGLFVSLVGAAGPCRSLGWPWWSSAIGDAFAASAVCWMIHVVLARLGAEQL